MLVADSRNELRRIVSMGSIEFELQRALSSPAPITTFIWSPTINDPIRSRIRCDDKCDFPCFPSSMLYLFEFDFLLLYLPLPGVIIILVKRWKCFYIENLTVYVGISHNVSFVILRCSSLYWLSTLCTLGGSTPRHYLNVGITVTLPPPARRLLYDSILICRDRLSLPRRRLFFSYIKEVKRSQLS